MSAFRNISVVIDGTAAPLVSAYAEASAASRAFVSQQEAANAVLRGMTAAQAEASAGLRAMSAASSASAGSVSRAGAATAAARREAATFGSTLGAAERSAGQLASAAGVAGAQAGVLGGQMTSAARSASAMGAGLQLAGQVGAAALAIGLIASVDAAAKFDREMHNVASIDKEVRDNFASTESQVLAMSRTLPQSANTLAQGLYNIASSGIYGASAMGVLGVSAQAASAGLTSTNTASKAIVAALNAYGLVANDAATTTENATRVSDALFNTVNYGVISFEALTSAVANSVGNAAQAGVGIEQLGSALATMTLSGMSASAAGVSLNNLLSKLVKPSAALGQEFTKLGISQGDLSDTGIGLYGVMMKLQASGDANIQTLLRWFPEIRSVRGAMALLSAGGANYQRIFEQMGTAHQNAGATLRVFHEQMKSTSAQFDLFKNKVEAAGISIGVALLPGLNRALAGLTTFLGGVKDAGAEILARAEPGFRALGRAIEDVAGVIHDLHVDQLAGDLARLSLGAVVVGFDALASAVAATTGFLRDHESIVVALAVAYGALRLEAVGAGFAALAVSARAAWVAMSDQAALLLFGTIGRLAAVMATLSTVVPSVTAALLAARNEFALGSALSGTFAGSLAALRVGFTGLAASAAASVVSMGLYGAAIVAVGVGLTQMASASRAAKETIAQSKAGFDVNDVNAYSAAIADAHRHQQDIANDWRVKGNDWADVLFPKLTQEGKAWGDQAVTLAGQHSTLTQSYATLESQLGLTESQIHSLANAAGIDLSQGLDKADASGKTARQTIADLAVPMRAAGIDTSDMSKAMDALSKATDGAKESLQSFNDTLGLLQGNGIAVIQAQDAFAESLVTLKTQLASNKEGLDGNTDAARANRKAYNDALSAAGVYGSSLSTYTGDAGAAQDATAALTGQVQATAVASGVAKTQVDAYGQAIDETSGSARDLASIGGVSVPVDAPGAANVQEQLSDIDRKILGLPPSASTTVSAPGAAQAATDIGGMQALMGFLPKSVSTAVSAPGATQATSDVGGFLAKLDLTPPTTSSTVSAPGAVEATGQVGTLNSTIGATPPTDAPQVSAPGATQATGEVGGLNSTIGATPGDTQAHVSAPGAVQAAGEVGSLVGELGKVTDRHATITVDEIIHTAQFGAIVGAAGRASGGPVYGPGTATSDSIPVRLSDREWVIQAKAADKYGHAAMASINAGTATVIPSPGYALGGPVGPVRPPGFASGGMVSGGGGSWQIVIKNEMPITLVGGATNNQTAAVIGAEVDRRFAKVVDHIRAGVGS